MKFREEKDELKHLSQGHTAQEIRRGFLSYNIIKIQRNEYITIMLIYVSIMLNVYIQLLNHMYKKRNNLSTANPKKLQEERLSEKF